MKNLRPQGVRIFDLAESIFFRSCRDSGANFCALSIARREKSCKPSKSHIWALS